MKNKTAIAYKDCTTVTISADAALTICFQSVFQNGFIFRCKVGHSIDDLLFRQLGLNRASVEKEVSTVFLDGKCVDDLLSAFLNEGSIVAFSSALPGLAGATLRRGGSYACLRDSITYTANNEPLQPREGTITVKLFNLLMEKLGPVFLRKGIIMKRSTAIDFLRKQNRQTLHCLSICGKPLSLDTVTEEDLFGNYDYVKLVIASEIGS